MSAAADICAACGSSEGELNVATIAGGRLLCEDCVGGDLPPLDPDPAAFYGLAGQIVAAVEPHTEAAPVVVLAQLLTAIGSAVGRSPGFRVEADRHSCNLFVAIVGPTATARKGSSWGHARRVVEMADDTWKERIATGASSGEGVIWQVRDPIEETRKAHKDEEPEASGFVTELADLGVEDKRLLIVESELASVLERMGREGNTLSAVLRQAWDGSRLDTLVKSNRAKATDAHISLIGHITVEELRRKLTATEQANGFANRILWLTARRSKVLPFGGRIEAVDWQPFTSRLHTAIEYGKLTGALGLDEEARELWADRYPALSSPRPGLLGAVTARGPAQVRRLAVIYALLDADPDRGAKVTAEHLRAALAVWHYSFESARFIFGERVGDPVVDAILASVGQRPDGITRSELSGALGRHRTADELDRAIAVLVREGRIRQEEEATSGRPVTRYLAKEAKEAK